jgi:magnesium transporter
MHATLLPLAEKYFEKDIVSAAHSLESMPESQAVAVLKALPPKLSAKAFAHLQPHYAAGLLKDLPPGLFEEIVSHLDALLGTAIFAHLSGDVREQVLAKLPQKIKNQIRDLLTFPANSAGRMMNTSFIAFWDDLTVEAAVQKIRSLAHKKDSPFYAYVMDKQSHLVGVINMRDLLIAESDALLGAVMRKDVFSVGAFMDREEVVRLSNKRRFFAVPVVDPEQRLIGVIDAGHLMHGVQEDATEDFQKMFGAGGDERVFSPVGFSLRKRLPWLHVNLATAFLAAFVVGCFQGIIAKITILAVFLPVVAGQGGNAGAQSLAVVMRGLVLREIPFHKAWQLILRESWIGTVNGVVIGIVTAAVTWAWQGNAFLGLVVGMGMLVNLVIAGFAGAAIPVAMKAIGLDPAQCSNIILTTITDVMGFLAFLGFAVIFQSHLI